MQAGQPIPNLLLRLGKVLLDIVASVSFRDQPALVNSPDVLVSLVKVQLAGNLRVNGIIGLPRIEISVGIDQHANTVGALPSHAANFAGYRIDLDLKAGAA